jgi:hypothetical protein
MPSAETITVTDRWIITTRAIVICALRRAGSSSAVSQDRIAPI